jgi:hypothetical protein
MKKSIKLIFIIIMLTGLSGCKPSLSHYEDKLYSEKIFTDYIENNINQNTNIFTRGKAIEKAILIFDKGLQTKVDRTKLSESIRLFRDPIEGTFSWHITWYENNIKKSYDCEIDSSNGEILSISKNDSLYSYDENLKFSLDDAKNIISPLLTELNININDYVLSGNSKMLASSPKFQYAGLTFINTNDKGKGFNINIDYKNKKVLSYSKIKPYEKYRYEY